MQKILNALPLLVVVGLIWFLFYKPNPDRPKLAKRPSQTESLRCKVVDASVYDGDTLKVKCGSREREIRLCGIDAPEIKQPLGIQSRDYLRSLLDSAKGEVIVVEMDRDKYGRIVAEVLFDTPQGERSVQEDMLVAGMTYYHKQSSSICLNGDVFDTAQQIGKSQQRGVWRLPGGGERPWDYRKQNQS